MPDSRQTRQLERGEVVHGSLSTGSRRMLGYATAFSRAPVAALWRHVLDLDAYVRFLPYVTASRVSGRESRDGVQRISCQLELTTLGVVSQYEMENAWYPERGLLSWLIRSLTPPGGLTATGSWIVQPEPGVEGRTRLSYLAEVGVNWWVPEYIRLRAANRGLPTIVRLIRERAEEEHGRIMANPA